MITNLYEEFKSVEDRWDWDKYIRQCDLIELSDADRSRAKVSFQYLRQLLGEGFLKKADKQHNPVFQWYFGSTSLRARLSMIRFTEALRALENTPSFGTVVRRIKKPREADEIAEGMSVIEVANKFLRAGFDVDFEPSVSVMNHRGESITKKPDIKIVNKANGEEIVVEVSRLRAGAHQNLVQRTYDIIWNVLMHECIWYDDKVLGNGIESRYILPYALIHRGIEDDELTIIVRRIKELIREVRTGVEFRELIIPGKIEVGIAHYGKHELAHNWAAPRGMGENDFIEGPDLMTDEIARAKGKLRDKLKQLPEDIPGIIVMQASENLIFFTHDINLIVEALAEEVGKHRKLLCAIMFHTFDDGKDYSLSENTGPHTIIRRIRSDGTVEQSIIIRNSSYWKSVSVETIGMVRSAFAY